MSIKKHHIQQLREQLYCIIPGYLNPSETSALNKEYETLIQRHYNRQSLHDHSVYPSDKSEARESHAMMISESESLLPKVDHDGCPTIHKLLMDHNKALTAATGNAVAGSSRILINYQRYTEGSKPVGEHFDGEYLKTIRACDGIEFQLVEGILPRFVGVMAVENSNNGKGVELVVPETQVVIKPLLHPGDMVLFDNIKLRHRVPTLERPRISIGMRNFDHMPLHFALNEEHFLKGARYEEIPEGYVSKNAPCDDRIQNFLQREWPNLREEYGSYV